MGRAVVATAMPGLSDYLINGETGILVGIGNDQEMAEAIEYLWRNPEVAEQMGRRGREWLAANFSLDQWLDQLVSAAHSVLNLPQQRTVSTDLQA
jgi:glycosyltransferase involved in cell wall biosynthesis